MECFLGEMDPEAAGPEQSPSHQPVQVLAGGIDQDTEALRRVTGTTLMQAMGRKIRGGREGARPVSLPPEGQKRP